jgi:DNA polymerase-3 subunit epsilon
MTKNTINFAAIDFETANKNHASVCSVGIVVVNNGEITDTLYHLIRPQPNFYCFKNTEIHGLSATDTCNAPEFPEVWAKIQPKLGNLPLVAHYSAFDEDCLKAAHKWYGLQYPEYVFHCTCRAAKKAFPSLNNHTLPTVASHVGFDFSNHHHALADAEACAAIAMKIIF